MHGHQGRSRPRSKTSSWLFCTFYRYKNPRGRTNAEKAEYNIDIPGHMIIHALSLFKNCNDRHSHHLQPQVVAALVSQLRH